MISLPSVGTTLPRVTGEWIKVPSQNGRRERTLKRCEVETGHMRIPATRTTCQEVLNHRWSLKSQVPLWSLRILGVSALKWPSNAECAENAQRATEKHLQIETAPNHRNRRLLSHIEREVLVQFEGMCSRKGAKAPRESMNSGCSFFSLRLCAFAGSLS